MSRILIVDDDPHLREVVRFALAQAGFAVEEAGDGRAALDAVDRDPPVLIVLDVMMPEIDGLEVCRAVRKTRRIPIVFLSSRDDEIDRVLGLELGGDDYLTKPFSPRELVARVRAVLRRLTPAETPAAPPSPRETITRGALRLDLDQWRAFYGGQEIILTATELELLAVLARTPGRVFSRDELIDRAYDGVFISERTIDSHIRRIRRKLGAGGESIETVHGVGYRLAAS